MIDHFDWLKRKDIRALSPIVMREVLESMKIISSVELLEEDIIKKLPLSEFQFVFADEDESRQVASEFFSKENVVFDSVFLRWTKSSVSEPQPVDGFEITLDAFHKSFMEKAYSQSELSSDWWRHVGAVLVSGEIIITAYNKHLPSEHTPYSLGDPRSFFKKGIGFELSTALHAEAGIVAKALREGVTTQGAKLYVTTFPCPPCANLISQTVISELYFTEGYALLDGEKILRDEGIKIFRVLYEKPSD
jgi:dCMP deaminase